MEQTQNTSGTVVGYFENHTDAQRAIEALHNAGFSSAHLGVAHRGASSTAHAAGNAASTFPPHASAAITNKRGRNLLPGANTA